MKRLVTRTHSLFAISIVIALFLMAAKADKVSLQYHLVKGSIYKIKTVADQVIDQTIMGQTQSIKNHIEGLMSFQVVNVEGTVYTLESWYDQLKMVIETSMGKQEMDSQSTDSGNPASAMFGKIINKHFTLKMKINGEVTEVNSGKLMDELVSGMDDQQAATSKEMLKQYLSDDALKSSLEMMTRCFPEGPVGVGDTWSTNTIINSLSADVRMNWKLVESKAGVSVIESDGTIKTKDNNPFVKMNGYPMKFDIKGDQKISSKIDEKTGWLQESTVSSEISGNVIVDASSQGGGTMEIPMKIISKSVITGTK